MTTTKATPPAASTAVAKDAKAIASAAAAKGTKPATNAATAKKEKVVSNVVTTKAAASAVGVATTEDAKTVSNVVAAKAARSAASTTAAKGVAPIAGESAAESMVSTPGEILLEEFLVPMGISQYRLAKAIGKPESAISQIVNGKREITTEMAWLLGRALGTSMEFWMNLELTYQAKTFDPSNMPEVTPLAL